MKCLQIEQKKHTNTLPSSHQAVAKHFEQMEVDEETVIGGFLDKCDGNKSYMEDNRVISFNAPGSQSYKRKRARAAALPGEQVRSRERERERERERVFVRVWVWERV